MKNRGKSVKSDQDKAKLFSDSNNFSSTLDLSCKKHPSSSSSVGICAFCLTEKLIKLVCSDCGEQRMSSCSCCSDLCSFRNSSCTVDVGSVGRISFLIDNEKDEQKTLFSHLQLKQSETGDETEDYTGDGVPRMSGLMDFEAGFSVIEIDLSGIDDDDDDDDDEFIDLNIDLCDKSKTEQSVFKKCDQLMVNDRGIKKVKNSHMQAWKWMFKHHSESNDHNHILKS
ncbi:hypothetical protein L1987_10932 [Smallanthus sonchifolius]|uniref:Uncharacterized protein n=1 Tax=Smallanthus sonchifolius TaxID=185202 RepID=A0ACB9JBS1_9ASTR|nr:hypothetical protein L1987_10932 [Smallanthus sonchifolius]